MPALTPALTPEQIAAIRQRNDLRRDGGAPSAVPYFDLTRDREDIYALLAEIERLRVLVGFSSSTNPESGGMYCNNCGEYR